MCAGLARASYADGSVCVCDVVTYHHYLPFGYVYAKHVSLLSHSRVCEYVQWTHMMCFGCDVLGETPLKVHVPHASHADDCLTD